MTMPELWKACERFVVGQDAVCRDAGRDMSRVHNCLCVGCPALPWRWPGSADPRPLRTALRYKNRAAIRESGAEGIACAELEEKEQRLKASDIELKPGMLNACKGAISNFCEHVEHGNARVIRCLQDHKNDPSMPEQCRKQVVGFQLDQSQDTHLRFRLWQACETDISGHCAEKQAGEIMECLLGMADLARYNTSFSRLDSSCATEVHRVAKQQQADARLMPSLFKGCRE